MTTSFGKHIPIGASMRLQIYNYFFNWTNVSENFLIIAF